jgi:RES domain
VTGTLTSAPHPASRLIPAVFMPHPAFDAAISADDARAILELEGWTKDRTVEARMNRLRPADWLHGVPNASMVMGAFLHVPPGGSRFNDERLGAWYAAASLPTSVAEVAHHLRREAVARGAPEARRQYRAYVARLAGADYRDIRGLRLARPGLYHPTDYSGSQRFGEDVRASGQAGIVFDSVRHAGGVNAVAFRPRAVSEIVQAGRYELFVPARGRIVALRLDASP